MSEKPSKCTRCGVDVPPILSGPPAQRDTWWRFSIRVKQRDYVLIFNRWTRRWLPEDPADQVALTYTDLALCDDCARAVFLFAQGKTP